MRDGVLEHAGIAVPITNGAKRPELRSGATSAPIAPRRVFLLTLSAGLALLALMLIPSDAPTYERCIGQQMRDKTASGALPLIISDYCWHAYGKRRR